MIRRIVGGLAVVVQICLASGASCPVTLAHVKRDTGIGDRNTYCFSLNVTNASGRVITELVLGGVAIDSKPWDHPLRDDYVVKNLQMGESRNSYFSTHRLLGTDYRGIRIWVKDIRFNDKSAWTDDGSHACSAEDVKKR